MATQTLVGMGAMGGALGGLILATGKNAGTKATVAYLLTGIVVGSVVMYVVAGSVGKENDNDQE